MPYNEGQLLLAYSAIQQGQIQNICQAAKIFSVPERTLRRRVNGTKARRDCVVKSRKLTDQEESDLVKHLLDLDSRGFSPKLHEVAAMANYLLANRAGTPVGIGWPGSFIKRKPQLKIRFNRKYDYQRAMCEDSSVIAPWFELVHNTISEYGITNQDMYNFDETGFQMGVVSTARVVTGSERRVAPKAIQPGNREWVTVIQGANAQGWALPPFIIFAGTYHLQAWYEEDFPITWPISLSENGWTTNAIGLDWLKHFNQHTKDRTQGTYRLLILDGHESHESLQFKQYCDEHKIITLCMPPHSSHLLQPLDVGCFGPLKKAYGNQIQHMMKCFIHHITKLEFLPAFKAAFFQAMTKDNIQGGFRGAGLMPFNPEVVLSKLDIRLRTPTPPPPAPSIWQSQTPSNALEISFQSELIRSRLQQHQNSSPTAIIKSLDRLARGAQSLANHATLVKAQVADLEAANKALAARKKRSKRRIQRQGTLTRVESNILIAQDQVDSQIGHEIDQARPQRAVGERRQYCCSGCGELGHRINQCTRR